MEPSHPNEDIAEMKAWPERLRNAVILNGPAGVRQVLENSNRNINTRNDFGLTALHLIVSLTGREVFTILESHSPGDQPSDVAEQIAIAHRTLAAAVRVLLDFGADPNASTPDGRGPLFLAVERGNSQIVGLLLGHGAEPDKFSSEDPPTALHLACDIGNPRVVQVLIDGGAEINVRDVEGATPLFRAVASKNLIVTRLLLQRGASTRISRVDGKSIFDIAEEDPNMIQLLKADRTIQGPRIEGFKAQYKPQSKPTILTYPPHPVSRDRIVACKGFHVQIVDFFTEGKRLEMIEKSAPVFDVLYSRGPTAIMQAARKTKMPKQRPNFTWYHLPANNVCLSTSHL